MSIRQIRPEFQPKSIPPTQDLDSQIGADLHIHIAMNTKTGAAAVSGNVNGLPIDNLTACDAMATIVLTNIRMLRQGQGKGQSPKENVPTHEFSGNPVGACHECGCTINHPIHKMDID